MGFRSGRTGRDPVQSSSSDPLNIVIGSGQKGLLQVVDPLISAATWWYAEFFKIYIYCSLGRPREAGRGDWADLAAESL